jgi:hypothetical protein
MRVVTEPGEAGTTASANYPALARAVEVAARRHDRIRDPLERARALSQVLAALSEQVNWVTADRDTALIDVFESGTHLSGDLGLSRQRVDQLAHIARAAGGPADADPGCHGPVVPASDVRGHCTAPGLRLAHAQAPGRNSSIRKS